MLKVLKNSLSPRVTEVLKAAGFQTLGPSGIVFTEAERAKTMELLLAETAAKDVASPAGQRRLEQLKAELIGKNLEADADVFARLCHEEIRKRVERWLSSSAGKETLELERRLAIDRNVRQERPKPAPFAQKPLPEGCDHDQQ